MPWRTESSWSARVSVCSNYPAGVCRRIHAFLYVTREALLKLTKSSYTEQVRAVLSAWLVLTLYCCTTDREPGINSHFRRVGAVYPRSLPLEDKPVLRAIETHTRLRRNSPATTAAAACRIIRAQRRVHATLITAFQEGWNYGVDARLGSAASLRRRRRRRR